MLSSLQQFWYFVCNMIMQGVSLIVASSPIKTELNLKSFIENIRIVVYKLCPDAVVYSNMLTCHCLSLTEFKSRWKLSFFWVMTVVSLRVKTLVPSLWTNWFKLAVSQQFFFTWTCTDAHTALHLSQWISAIAAMHIMPTLAVQHKTAAAAVLSQCHWIISATEMLCNLKPFDSAHSSTYNHILTCTFDMKCEP